MNYMVTRKGFAKVLLTTTSYDDAMDFINSEVTKQVAPIDYTESTNDRYEKFEYLFNEYTVTFG